MKILRNTLLILKYNQKKKVKQNYNIKIPIGTNIIFFI